MLFSHFWFTCIPHVVCCFRKFLTRFCHAILNWRTYYSNCRVLSVSWELQWRFRMTRPRSDGCVSWSYNAQMFHLFHLRRKSQTFVVSRQPSDFPPLSRTEIRCIFSWGPDGPFCVVVAPPGIVGSDAPDSLYNGVVAPFLLEIAPVISNIGVYTQWCRWPYTWYRWSFSDSFSHVNRSGVLARVYNMQLSSETLNVISIRSTCCT